MSDSYHQYYATVKLMNKVTGMVLLPLKWLQSVAIFKAILVH